MAKKAYFGVNGVARKISKGYIGVNGVARKISKGYIGVGGVARPFWAGGVPTYYGTAPSVNRGKTINGSLSFANTYAMFAGGRYSTSSKTDDLDIYDNSLTKSRTGIYSAADIVACCSAGSSYAIIGSGSASTNRYLRGWDINLTQSGSLDLGSSSYRSYCAGSLKSYGVFPLYGLTTVVYFDTSLTKGTTTQSASFTGGSSEHSKGVSLGDGALFIEFYRTGKSSGTGRGFYISNTLTKTNLTNVPTHGTHAAAYVGNKEKVVFGGDRYDDGDHTYAYANVSCYNSSLVLSTAPNLSAALGNNRGVSLGGYAMLTFGQTISSGGSGPQPYVDYYDTALTKATLTVPAEYKRTEHGAAANGNYVVLGGGSDGISYMQSAIALVIV